MSLFDEIDKAFGKASKSKSAKKPLLKNSPSPSAPPAPRYWLPEAVVLFISQWRCACGAEGTCSPVLCVKERSGKQTRLRAITRSSQYALLSREVERAEPSLIHDCPSCFSISPFGHPQRELPLGSVEPLFPFVESIREGIEAALFVETLTDPRNYSQVKNNPALGDLRLSFIANQETPDE